MHSCNVTVESYRIIQLSNSTGQWACYSDLNKKMSKLVISEEQTLSNITKEQQIVFDKFARYYLVGYLLLDKLKDVPLKKWTKQFSYEYYS